MSGDRAAGTDVKARVASSPARFNARRRLLVHGALAVAAVVMLYPLLWMLASSLKPEDEIFSSPDLWPDAFQLGNYVAGWLGTVGPAFGIFFSNSITVAVGCVLGNLIACSLAAYAFARLDFRFRKFWFAVMLTTIMLPIHVQLIPQYILFHYIGWVNTFLPLIVPKFLAMDPFFIFLLVQFIRGIPSELDDAARIDGAGPVRIFRYILLPLLKPALATTAVFTFVWTYNDFFSQLIYLTDINLYTVPLGLRLFLNSISDSSWGPMFAMSVLSLVPIFVLFLGFQRLLVQGIATSGLKG